MNPQEKHIPSNTISPESKVLPVKFITEKDNAFRIFHADGVWGMANATGNLQLNFFVEHYPLPDAVINSVGGEMEIIEQKDDEHIVVTRNYQTAIVLSLESAKTVHLLLGNFIKVAEDATKSNDDE